MPLLSEVGATSVRRALSRTFGHTYTLLPADVTGSNADNEDVPVPRDPVVGLPCRYAPQDDARISNGGEIILNRPVMSVPYDAEIDEDDSVRDVIDASGNLILAGPLKVDTIKPDAAFGPVIAKRVYLRNARGTV